MTVLNADTMEPYAKYTTYDLQPYGEENFIVNRNADGRIAGSREL
jgi:hypothetical protein